ncbi:UDP-N-acetylmuramoyl-tripeptide--D-alanyl-D-alanine ligase, partial [Acidaminococcus timonensis]
MLKLSMICKALSVESALPQDTGFTDVITDSRVLVPGCLFLALVGEKFDGHGFVARALAEGAAAAVVSRVPEGVDPDKCLVVPDTLKAYQQIATAWRLAQKDLTVIAITGSNGKTSTKDCIAAVLGEKYRFIKTQANFNNEIGLPKTLLTIRPDTEMAVVEMGMRGLGQIRAMKHIAYPDGAVITNVGDTHLELLGSLENIAKAKSEILEDFTPKNHAFLNGDDPRVSVMKTGATVHFYGIDSDADVKAIQIKADGLSTTFTYRSR